VTFLKNYKRKLSYLLFVLTTSLFLSIVFQPLLNEKALDTLVNIYSILAGFLIGVIALIGDPSSLPSGSWRIAESSVSNTFRKLRSTKLLLSTYLITLFAIFIYKLFSSPQVAEVISTMPFYEYFSQYKGKIKMIFESAILFLSFLAFFYSFSLPNSLFAIQKRRVEKEIQSRRESVNIKD